MPKSKRAETNDLNSRLTLMRDDALAAAEDWHDVYQDGLNYVFNNQLAGKRFKDGWEPIVCNYIFPAMMQELALISQRNSIILARPVESDDQQAAEILTSHLQWLYDYLLKTNDHLLRAALDGKMYGHYVGMTMWEPKARWDDRAKVWRGEPRVHLIRPEYFGADPEAENIDAAGYIFTRRRIRRQEALRRWPKFRDEIEDAPSLEEDVEAQAALRYSGLSIEDADVEEFSDQGRLVRLLTGQHDLEYSTARSGHDYVTVEQFFWIDGEEQRRRDERNRAEEDLLASGEIVQDGALFRWGETGELVKSEDWPKELVNEYDEPKYPNGRFAIRIGDTILNASDKAQRWPYRKWPIVVGVNHLLPHTWHGLNGVEMAKGLQDWINVTATHMRNYINSFADPIVVMEDGARPQGAGPLPSKAGSIWRVVKGALNKVRREPPPEMSGSTFQIFDRMAAELRDQTGVQEVGLGRASGGKQTAEEVIRLETNTRMRTALGNKLLDSYVKGIYERVSEMCQLHYSADEYVRVVGQKGAVQARQITQQMKEIEFDIRLEVGTALPFDRERKKQDAAALFQMFGMSVAPEVLEAYEIGDKDEMLSRLEAWQAFKPVMDNPELLGAFQQFMQMQQAQGGADGTQNRIQ
jgi:hypothetical protein